MPDLAAQIEAFLFAEARWVPVGEICARFGINERQIRAHGRKRPLLAAFAISSDRPGANGFKHVAHTTTRERIDYKHRQLRNLVARARAIRDYNLAVARATRGKWPTITDGNGNGVLPLG